jgi:hypothetical protein
MRCSSCATFEHHEPGKADRQEFIVKSPLLQQRASTGGCERCPDSCEPTAKHSEQYIKPNPIVQKSVFANNSFMALPRCIHTSKKVLHSATR